MDPTVGSVRELALAAGFDVNLQLIPLSDPDAGRAARALLDSHFDYPRTRELDAWTQRLKRWIPDGNPTEIVRVAGQSSSLLKRKNALYLRGSVNELKLASAGAFTKGKWLLSGAPAIGRIGGSTDVEPNGAFVAYSTDVRRFVRVLDHVETVRPEKANLIVAEYTDDLEQDSWDEGAIRLVAPIQGLIDAFGIGGHWLLRRIASPGVGER